MQLLMCAKKAIKEPLYIYLSMDTESKLWKTYQQDTVCRHEVIKVGIEDLNKLERILRSQPDWKKKKQRRD